MASKKVPAKKVIQIASNPANDLRENAQKLWLAGVGAVNLAKKNVQSVISTIEQERGKLLEQAEKLVTTQSAGVRKQVSQVVVQLQDSVTANLSWAEEKVSERVGAVMGRLGVPSKADIVDLSKRVSELSKQVKAMQQSKRKAA